MQLTLRLLGGELSILRLPADAVVPSWLQSSAGPMLSVTRTARELSIVCPSGAVPPGIACEAEWRAFTVEDALPFCAIGILASILEPLAAAGISILSISTFDTDYVLVRLEVLEKAKIALKERFLVIE